jgi:EAL domain-containing protein (putative c-di-GMP-specific phosphodiesterase class I)
MTLNGNESPVFQPILSLMPRRSSVLALHPRSREDQESRTKSIPNWLPAALERATKEQMRTAFYIEADAETLLSGGIERLLDVSRTFAPTKKQLIVEIGGRGRGSIAALSDVLDELRWVGIHVAVTAEFSDASFRLLLSTHPDYLRISDYIVRDCSSDFHRQGVIEAAVHMAWRFGAAVIADGVTSALDLKTLQTLGVDYAEGGLLCKPLPFDDAIHWTERVGKLPAAERRHVEEGI